MDRLREMLEAHAKGMTLAEIAQLLGVSTRSARRYLAELDLVTDLESVPMVRAGGEHLWRIKPSERGRDVTLRRTQAYAILATRRVFDVLRGSALFDDIDLAMKQVERIASRPSSRTGIRGDAPSDARLDERFAYLPVPPRAYANRADDVDTLFRAVAECRVLRFRHRDASSERERGSSSSSSSSSARVVAHPYALVLHGGGLTCIARDVGTGAHGAFALDAMSDLDASEIERFDLPADFDLSQWAHGDFGVGRAARSVRVTVEFEPRAADRVRARRVHASQKVGVAADGRVRVSVAVPDAPGVMAELRRWVLGFGGAARVVEPRPLADEIAAELRRALSRYDEG